MNIKKKQGGCSLMLIYRAVCLENGKSYIGQTIYGLKRRIKQHEWFATSGKTDSKFHNALRKHGLKNFVWSIIDTAETIQSLNEKEIYWIKFYDSVNLGYNIESGGKNAPVSDETRKKISDATKGRVPSRETKMKRLKTREATAVSKESEKQIVKCVICGDPVIKTGNRKKYCCICSKKQKTGFMTKKRMAIRQGG